MKGEKGTRHAKGDSSLIWYFLLEVNSNFDWDISCIGYFLLVVLQADKIEVWLYVLIMWGS